MKRSRFAQVASPPRPSLKPVVAAVAGLLSGGVALSAHAELMEEIVVTATKRAETAHDTPLAITALSGDFTRETNLDDVKDLVLYTPGVSGNSQDSFIDAISVRGIRTQDFGVGGDPSGAFFKNDLYEGRNGSAVTSLYDMDRVEILRGPQGFLFGRNSIGGAFSVHTAKAEPGDHITGYAELDAAERNRLVFEGAMNIPVSDRFATRIAGYYSREDGFVDNAFGGDDLIEPNKRGARWSTRYDGDRASVDTLVEYERRKQSGSVYRAIDTGDIWDTFEAALGDQTLSGGRYDADSDLAGGNDDDARILTLGLHAEIDLGFAALTANTGFKDHDYYYNEDYDGTPLNLNNYGQDQEGSYFQQELRLTSEGESMFSWYAGASYYREKIDTLFRFSGKEDYFCQYYGYASTGLNFNGCADLYAYYGSTFDPAPDGLLTETGRIKGKYSGWAAYADLNFQLTEQFDVSLGARYTKDTKRFALDVPEPESGLGPYWAYGFSTDGFVRDKKSWTDLQTRVVARYFVTDDHLLFANYTEGFKSGGFGSFAIKDANGSPVGGGFTGATQADGFRPVTFDPEVADSYEAGYKGKLADGAIRLSVTGFHYRYKDLQVIYFDGGAAAVKNVGEVKSSGVELSANVLLGENWDIYLAWSYLDSEAKNLQDICGLADTNGCEGSELFWAPSMTGAFVLNGRFPLNDGTGITARLETFYESKKGGGWEDLKESEIDPFLDVTLRVGYDSGRAWGAELYCENLTNEKSWDGQNVNGGVLPSQFFGPKRPRTFGVRFNYRWE
ncbi:MAG: TonB-dependent receptor [Pseudomonadales bacterium]|nr:TonB-dependent receptor [Pseudomonadales bacterium]